MDPTIQGLQILVRGPGSRWIRRSRGHRSLSGVQDPDGSDDPGAMDPCGGCRIQMDLAIQRPQILVSGPRSMWGMRAFMGEDVSVQPGTERGISYANETLKGQFMHN